MLFLVLLTPSSCHLLLLHSLHLSPPFTPSSLPSTLKSACAGSSSHIPLPVSGAQTHRPLSNKLVQASVILQPPPPLPLNPGRWREKKEREENLLGFSKVPQGHGLWCSALGSGVWELWLMLADSCVGSAHTHTHKLTTHGWIHIFRCSNWLIHCLCRWSCSTVQPDSDMRHHVSHTHTRAQIPNSNNLGNTLLMMQCFYIQCDTHTLIQMWTLVTVSHSVMSVHRLIEISQC